MKIQVLFVLLLCGSLSAPAQKKLLLGGSGWNKIVLLDKKNKQVEWSHKLSPGDECNCVAYTKKGQILYAYRKGARLITKDEKTVWDYPVKEKGNCTRHRCCLTADSCWELPESLPVSWSWIKRESPQRDYL